MLLLSFPPPTSFQGLWCAVLRWGKFHLWDHWRLSRRLWLQFSSPFRAIPRGFSGSPGPSQVPTEVWNIATASCTLKAWWRMRCGYHWWKRQGMAMHGPWPAWHGAWNCWFLMVLTSADDSVLSHTQSNTWEALRNLNDFGWLGGLLGPVSKSQFMTPGAMCTIWHSVPAGLFQTSHVHRDVRWWSRHWNDV